MTRAELIDGLKHLLNHANDEGITEIHAEFVAKIIAALAGQQSERPAVKEGDKT